LLLFHIGFIPYAKEERQRFPLRAYAIRRLRNATERY